MNRNNLTQAQNKFLKLLNARIEDRDELHHYSDYVLQTLKEAAASYSQNNNIGAATRQLVKGLDDIVDADIIFKKIKRDSFFNLFSKGKLLFSNLEITQLEELISSHLEEINAAVKENPYYHTLKGDPDIELKRDGSRFKFGFMDEEIRDEFMEELESEGILTRPLSPHIHLSQQTEPHEEFFVTLSLRDIKNITMLSNFIVADYDFDMQKTSKFMSAKPDKGIGL